MNYYQITYEQIEICSKFETSILVWIVNQIETQILDLKLHIKDLKMKSFYRHDVTINKTRTEAKRNNNNLF